MGEATKPQTLAAAQRIIEQQRSDMEALTASIRHDLRAPLRAMQGFAEALLEDYAAKLDPQAEDYARRIVVAAQTLDTHIRDLAEYTRLGTVELPLSSVDLNQVVQDAMARLDEENLIGSAAVIVEEPLPRVIAHGPTLTKIVAQLLSNAVKFVGDGDQARVRVLAEPRGDRVRLWVEDNGIGVPEHQRDSIFGMFERLHGIETYPGNGMGLALVRRGADQIGGAVGVESVAEDGNGSRFWIELPAG
jgi:signal transduction histidine kinase